jgi:hypothetical protein
MCIHSSTSAVQIGYCGLDKESLGAGPDVASLDIEDYCMGYVSWDLLMMFLQVVPALRVLLFPCCSLLAGPLVLLGSLGM